MTRNNKENWIRYYNNHREEINERKRNNKEKIRKQDKKYRTNLKFLVLSTYSKNNYPECECCGNTNLEHLTLDHIDGNGNKHRKENKISSGSSSYRWIIRNNFPDGFRVLCFNCNQSFGSFGYCPHKDKKRHEEYINLLK